jgi:hypothetical protein
MFDLAQRLSDYVWVGPKAIRLCLSRPKGYPINLDSAQRLSDYVWVGLKVILLCLSRTKVYPLMSDSAQRLSDYVWVGPKAIRLCLRRPWGYPITFESTLRPSDFFIKQTSVFFMVMEKSLLRISLILRATSESYLFPVTTEGEVKFQGVCVRLCRFYSCWIWRRVVWYWTGVTEDFVVPIVRTSCHICPWWWKQQDTVNICILLLDCMASYQKKQKKKTSRRFFDTAVLRIYLEVY